MKCPNKNSKLYKRLITQFSEDNVYRIWDAITTPEFDKWYGNGVRDNLDMPFINKYLQITNDKGQVGNLLNNTVKFKSTNDVEKFLSSQTTQGIHLYKGKYYISKNKRKQGINMMKLINHYYPNAIQETTYFTASKAIGVNDPSTPVMALQLNDVFTKEGKIYYSPAREDSILEDNATVVNDPNSKFDYLIDRLDEYKTKLHDKIRDAQRKAKETGNWKKVESLKQKQEDILNAIDELKIDQTVTNIKNIADINLDYVEELFENKENITTNDLAEIHRLLSYYENLDSTEKDKFPISFLNENDYNKITVYKVDVNGNEYEELDYLESTKKVMSIAQRASRLRSDYNQLEKELSLKELNSIFSKDYTESEVFENVTDITATSRTIRDAGSVNRPLLSLIHSINNDATRIANQETIEDTNELKDHAENLKKSKLFKRLGNTNFMKLLWQKDENGNYTGGLINRYANKYWQKRKNIYSDLYSSSLQTVNEAKKEYYKNHEFVNYFTNEKEKQIEIERLSQIFDRTRVEKIVEEMSVEFDEYRSRRDIAFESIEDTNLSRAEKNRRQDKWLLRNNPVTSINNIKEGKTDIDNNGNMIKFNAEFVRAIPLKVNRSGENTDFYDSSFEQVENDTEALEYYNYVKTTIKELLSFYPRAHLDKFNIHEGFIPVLGKDMFKQLKEQNIAGFKGKLKEKIQSWYSIKTHSKTTEHLTGTGEVIDSLNIQMLSPKFNYVESGTVVNTDSVVLDLNDILAEFIPLTNMYKHKSRVEATHGMAIRAIDHLQGVKKTPTGVIQKNLKNTNVKDELVELKKLAGYYDEFFYGKHEKDTASKKKVSLTKEEKDQLKELDIRKKELIQRLTDEADTLTKEEEEKIINSLESIERRQSDLGRNLSGTKGIKSTLQYYQAVSQGWNIGSAAIELIYGGVSNIIHGAGEADYTNKQRSNAARIAFMSVMPGNSSKIAKKFNAAIEIFDAVGEVAEIESGKKNNSKRVKFSTKQAIKPYELMRNSDKVSKGTVLVAVLMNTNLEGGKLQKGETSLWEALDENGKISEKFRTAETVAKWEYDFDNLSSNNTLLRLATKVAQINKRNHGNYDPNSPIYANSSAMGKMLLQFRRWMLEGFATRFESAEYNDILERNVKGRYRTYATLVSELKGDDTYMHGVLRTSNLMLKSLIMNFGFTNINDEQLLNHGVDPTKGEFSTADLENIRKNAAGLKWLIVVYTVLAMLKNALLDDDDKKGATALNFLLNQGGRLQDDLNFYANPSTMSDITKDVVPVFKLADKLGGWFTAMGNSVLDLDPEYSTTYERGDFKGSSKLLIKSGEVVPGSAAFVRTLRSMSKLY